MSPDGKTIRRLRTTLAAQDPKFPQTAQDFAEQVGISASALSRIETEVTHDATPETMRRIARGLNVSVLAIAVIEGAA